MCVFIDMCIYVCYVCVCDIATGYEMLYGVLPGFPIDEVAHTSKDEMIMIELNDVRY